PVLRLPKLRPGPAPDRRLTRLSRPASRRSTRRSLRPPPLPPPPPAARSRDRRHRRGSAAARLLVVAVAASAAATAFRLRQLRYVQNQDPVLDVQGVAWSRS